MIHSTLTLLESLFAFVRLQIFANSVALVFMFGYTTYTLVAAATPLHVMVGELMAAAAVTL